MRNHHKKSRPFASLACAATAAMLALLPGNSARAGSGISLPEGFHAIDMTDTLNAPVAIAFAPDGRLFVVEKRGVVKVYEKGAKVSTFINLQAEVNAAGDRGMLGIALDPNFATNHYVYLLYVVDPVQGSPDEGPDAPTFTRLVRYKGTAASDGGIADKDSRTILMGVTPSKGSPVCRSTHSAGTMQFAPDGSLLLALGEGAKYEVADAGGETPDCFGDGLFGPGQNVGAFRAQILNSLGGKILRINPATGKGYSTNPFYDGNTGSTASKIWAYGLRNPFRFTMKTGSYTGVIPTIFVADVGWNDWEELNAVHGGENFGWPCYEGFDSTTLFPDETPSAGGCDTVGTPANPGPLTAPIMVWSHSDPNLSIPSGFMGQAGVTGAFVGTKYPSPYRKRIVIGDWLQGWIKMVRVDADDQFSTMVDFATNAGNPTDFAIDPVTKDMCYSSMYYNRVYRIHYTAAGSQLVAPVEAPGEPVTPACPADLAPDWGDSHGDGLVDINDLLAGIQQASSKAHESGAVPDIAAILNAWGVCPQ